jgi:hypothetical protein
MLKKLFVNLDYSPIRPPFLLAAGATPHKWGTSEPILIQSPPFMGDLGGKRKGSR